MPGIPGHISRRHRKSSPAFAGEGERACEAGPGDLLTAQPDAEHRLAQHGGGAALAEAEAEAGMAEMSKVFRETGSELYMGAGGREHD